MENREFKSKFVLNLVAMVLISCATSFAQSDSTKLVVGIPSESELTEATPKRFSTELSANQTARVEVEYQGYEIVLMAYDSSGKSFIKVESPSGAIGKRVLF